MPKRLSIRNMEIENKIISFEPDDEYAIMGRYIKDTARNRRRLIKMINDLYGSDYDHRDYKIRNVILSRSEEYDQEYENHVWYLGLNGDPWVRANHIKRIYR